MIKRVHHLGLAVADLQAALDLYTGPLGAHLESRGRSEGEDMEYALVRVGDTELELMSSDQPESAVGKFLARRGPGVHHVAYEVDDVVRASGDMQRAGFEMVGTIRTGLHGRPVAFIHPRSMGGVLTELVQRG